MIYVSRDIPDEDLLHVVRDWIDILAQKRYDEFFHALGYAMGGNSASADWIKSDLRILIETNSPEGLLLKLEEISIPVRGEPGHHA